LASTYSKNSPENYSYNNIMRNEIQQKVSIKESDRFMLTSELWDCEIRMFEANGFGDFIDNTDAVTVIKNHVASAHKEWRNLNCNEVTDQVQSSLRILTDIIYPVAKLKGT
jgi:septin family protein